MKRFAWIKNHGAKLVAALLGGGTGFLAGEALTPASFVVPDWVVDGAVFEPEPGEKLQTDRSFYSTKWADAPREVYFTRVEQNYETGEWYWANRLYDIGAGSSWTECYVHGFGVLVTDDGRPSGKIEGHAWYLNVAAGGITWTRCVAAENHGQAWQIEFRDGTGSEDTETNLPPPTGADWLRWIKCGSMNNGIGEIDRASWPFSIAATGANVLMRGCWVWTVGLEPWVDPVKGTVASRGGVLLQSMDGVSRTPQAIFENMTIVIDDSDREAFYLDDIDGLVIRGGMLIDLSNKKARIRIGPDVIAWKIKGVGGEWELHHDLNDNNKVDAGELFPQGDWVWPRP